MLYGRHASSPSENIFDQVKLETANFSGRMDNLRSSILIPQLEELDKKVTQWNKLYNVLNDNLKKQNGIFFPNRDSDEYFVGSSIQFRIDSLNNEQIKSFINNCKARGVELKWFGDEKPVAYTSRYDSWKYLDNIPRLANTLRILAKTFDMRIPLTFTVQDCNIISKIIIEELQNCLLYTSDAADES